MARKKTLDELTDEILRDFDAGDTPSRRAQTALQQARDAGDSGLRQQFVQQAIRHMAGTDPRREPQLMQRLQAEVLALQGRGGDTEMAHVTPGEVVLPAWAQTPELMNYLAAKAREAGADPRRFQVGSGKNRINPRTGLMELGDENSVQRADTHTIAAPPVQSTAPNAANDLNEMSEQQRQDELGRVAPSYPEMAFPTLRGLYALGAAAIPGAAILAGDTAMDQAAIAMGARNALKEIFRFPVNPFFSGVRTPSLPTLLEKYENPADVVAASGRTSSAWNGAAAGTAIGDVISRGGRGNDDPK